MITRNDDESLDTIETPARFLNKRVGIFLKDSAINVMKIGESSRVVVTLEYI